MKSECIRIDFNLILPHVPTHAGHLADAGHRLKLIADDIVLQGAELGEIHLPRAFKDIIKDLTEGGCVGAERRRYAFWQGPDGCPEAFQHPRAGPIEIGPVVERNLYEAVAEHALAADAVGVRDSQQSDGQRVGYLVLDVLR